MRTKNELVDLIHLYTQELDRQDISGLYVITADAMTVNKNDKGRYEVSKEDLPTTFNRSNAGQRINIERSKKTLFSYRIMRYSQWLKRELQKLKGLQDAQNISQQGGEMEAEEPSNDYIINMHSLTFSKCPIKCNNCLCCRFATDIYIEDCSIKISCSYPRS